MSGFLGPVAQKVVNLLGMTALGQKTKATALGVTLASDEDALPITVPAGSDVTEGNTTDVAVDTDTTGTVSGKLRGLVKLMVNLLSRWPAALGQGAMAASLPVAIANNQDFVHAEDAGHTTGDKGIMALAMRADVAAAVAGTNGDYIPLITDDTGRLWADVGAILGLTSAGQAAMSASLPVAIACNQTPLKSYHDRVYFLITASGGTAYQSGDATIIDNISATRTLLLADPASGTKLDTDAAILDYFDGADAQFDDRYIWIYIPMRDASGNNYRKFFLSIVNSLGVNATVYVYGLIDDFQLTALPITPVSSSEGSFQIATGTIATGVGLNTGNGGTTLANNSDWPIETLLVIFKPASDVAAGRWSLSGVLEA